MELKFNLKYFLGVSFDEFDNTELSELIWMAIRIKQQLDKEKAPKNMRRTDE